MENEVEKKMENEMEAGIMQGFLGVGYWVADKEPNLSYQTEGM